MIMITIGLFLLLLVLLPSSGVSALGSVVSRSYHRIGSHFTWQEAQDYCENSYYYTDLATAYTQSDVDSMYLDQYSAWVGFHRNQYFDHWFWTDGSHHFKPWADHHPVKKVYCAYVSSSSKKLYSTSCEDSAFFICHKYIGSKLNYTFIPQSASWSDAQQYCRNEFDNLATIEDDDGLDDVVKPRDFPLWIGLRRHGGAWKWGTGMSEYRNWAPNEPGNKGDCVSISSLSKVMATQNCSARFPSVCFRENLILVRQNKTWEEALQHCRSLKSPYLSNHYYELLSVQPEDHDVVMTKLLQATVKVWVGLRFLAGEWVWVNGADLSYPDLPSCPHAGQRCGVVSKDGTVSVETTDCTEKWNFLCYSP